MAIGRVNTGGAGGGSGKFAAIGVSYPEGSICTCTDGNKTFKAIDTSGVMLFLVPYAATWTISCSNGEKATIKSVAITTYGQVSSVSLAYRLTLIENGVDKTEVSLSVFATNYIGQKNADGDYQKFGVVNNNLLRFATNNLVNIGTFANLYVEGYHHSISGTAGFYLIVDSTLKRPSSSEDITSAGFEYVYTLNATAQSQNTLYTIPIAPMPKNANGEACIGFSIGTKGWNNNWAWIKNLYFE